RAAARRRQPAGVVGAVPDAVQRPDRAAAAAGAAALPADPQPGPPRGAVGHRLLPVGPPRLLARPRWLRRGLLPLLRGRGLVPARPRPRLVGVVRAGAAGDALPPAARPRSAAGATALDPARAV